MTARGLLLRGVGAALTPSLWRLRRALANPAAARARLMHQLGERLVASRYGQDLGLTHPSQFSSRVPVVDYDSLEPWLERQRLQETAELTPERVLFYEKTSGSSGAAKYIPYTASLRRSFSRMFAAWAADLLTSGPRLATGKLYMSVSPSFAQDESTPQGRAVGMTDDRDYLDSWLRPVVAPFLIGHGLAATDARSFKRAVLELLVAEAELEVISIWNPSFLLVLLDELAADPRAIATALGSRLSPSRRDALLAGPIDWPRLWPQLKLISCWAAAAAAPLAARVARLLPHAMVQGKGLLATEAPITVPLIGAPGPAPMISDILIELEDDGGRLHALHHAQQGAEYGVVISQSAGLYRYRMGDRVVVGPRIANTPTLTFVGRAGGVSDLVGEKLSERFVGDTLARVHPAAGFQTLVPMRIPRDHYILLVDHAPQGDHDQLARAVDEALSAAHHYRHARALDQLGPVRVCIAKDAASLATFDYAASGLKLGDIKPRALHGGPVAPALACRLARGDRPESAHEESP